MKLFRTLALDFISAVSKENGHPTGCPFSLPSSHINNDTNDINVTKTASHITLQKTLATSDATATTATIVTTITIIYIDQTGVL